MKLADSGLNPQASALVDAQTDIKIIVKNGLLRGRTLAEINRDIQNVVRRALARVRSPTLRSDAYFSLNRFADRIYNNLSAQIGNDGLYLAAILLLAVKNTRPQARLRAERIVRSEGDLPVAYHTDAKGIPLQEYAKTYMKRVSSALSDLAKENALDPNDVSGRNSLRNLAEMQVRYERHQEEISDLKSDGHKLVVCSVHADCSDRCAPYQGRIYSLDGTSGTTADGKPYVPLEEATENPRDLYTTKAGRTYQNGLLGFNCRHKLVPYREGMAIPKVSKEEQQRENKINTRQRVLERAVIDAREQALAMKGVNREEYLYWRNLAIERNKRYIQFSHDNGRAYYPDRTKIL